jgi:hypothetical protein
MVNLKITLKNKDICFAWVGAFAAGFFAVLLAHQPTLFLLSALKVTQTIPYSMKPVAPFGVPQFLSASFWGGVWGIAFYFANRHWNSDRSYWVKSFLFGMIFPTSAAWFIVAPLKGAAVAAGGKPSAMLTGLCVNAAWGLGTAMLLLLFHQWTREQRST